jgi:hypothetical protein
MTSPVVTRLLKSNRSVVQHIDTNAESLDAKLRARLKPHLRGGEKMPDLALVFALLGRLLAAEGTALAAADDANEAEKRDDPGFMHRLEAANETLYGVTTRAREMLAGAFTSKALASLGFKGETPRAPDTLVRFASNVISALDTHTLAPADDGASVDVKKVIKRLSPARDAVHALAGDVLREARELQKTQAVRNAALGQAVDAFDGVAGAVSALLDLVGETALAERTRPSTRRSGVTQTEAVDPVPGDPTSTP